MKTSPLRIALVNDYEIVLAGIREMLAPYADKIDVVEMDANTDVISPVDIALYDTYGQGDRALASVHQPLNDGKVDKVVLFTWNHTQAMVDAAEAAGVDGLLSKTMTADELVTSLQRIAGGERLITPCVRVSSHTGQQSGSKADWPGRMVGLTMRESEMLTLIAQGMSNAEIAEHTYLSPNSVKSYIRSAYRKIKVKRRSQAVAWGIEHGMLPDRSRSIIV
ncbi:response regulator transcription factor [Luteococcus sp. H138]|uniref:response regulator transcription factor n=1 Tax=unclassified Luteococcus TaxID=2639923 RepID=UPI00313D5819